MCQPYIESAIILSDIIGKQSNPLSDKLGGEISISSLALVCLSPYISYMVYVRPDNQYHAHCDVCTHTLTPDIAQKPQIRK